MPFDPNFFARQTALQQNQPINQSLPQPQPHPHHWNPQYVSREHTSHTKQEVQTDEKRMDSANRKQSNNIEPIYQEISEVGGNHRSQRSWSGSRSNLVTQRTSVDETSTGHKRTYSGGDLLSVKKSASVRMHNGERREEKGDLILPLQPPLPQESSTLDRLKWQSSSTRHPPRHIAIQPQYEPNDDESIPNSPSFYTKNPEAATMPDSSAKQHQTQRQQHGHEHGQSHHFFKDHLTSLDSSAPPGGHNRVMNWMQHGTVWDPVLMSQPGTGMGGLPPLPPVQLERSVSMSHSVHSQLSSYRGGVGKRLVDPLAAAQQNQSSKFQDHLYEDPDHVKSVVQNSMMGVGSMSTKGVAALPRVRSLPRSNNPSLTSLPYVTRELSSKSGSTMYATDV